MKVNCRPRCKKHYASYDARLKSFERWSLQHTQTKEDLAECGYFHTGLGDEVNCYACDSAKYLWKKDENPWIVHARNKECPFIGANDAIVQHNIAEMKRIAKEKEKVVEKAKKGKANEAMKKAAMEKADVPKTAKQNKMKMTVKEKKMTVKEKAKIVPYDEREEFNLLDEKDKCVACVTPGTVEIGCIDKNGEAIHKICGICIFRIKDSPIDDNHPNVRVFKCPICLKVITKITYYQTTHAEDDEDDEEDDEDDEIIMI